MTPEWECVVTASFLRSGRVLSNVSNCGALIAGVGMLLAHAAAGRLLFAASIGCWPVACYFGLRVAIDAALFQELAGGPADGWHALDELLFTRASRGRAENERSASAAAAPSGSGAA